MLSIVFYVLLAGVLTLNGDEGSGLDPHGGSRTSLSTDAGCGIDPEGRPCAQTLGADEGPGIDPHG
jgi:hypothetical protein